MIIKNYYEKDPKLTTSHKGEGSLKDVVLFNDSDFHTNLRFFRYMVLPAGTSIGYHKHGDNEELYVILKGNGLMHVNDDEVEVKSRIKNEDYIKLEELAKNMAEKVLG